MEALKGSTTLYEIAFDLGRIDPQGISTSAILTPMTFRPCATLFAYLGS
jgi:hypothetical protein